MALIIDFAVEMCNRGKLFMEHNSFMSRFVPILRKCGIAHFVHMMRNSSQRKYWTAEDEANMRAYFADHRAEFEKLSGMLEDDFSRETLAAVMRFRISKEMSVLKGYTVQPQYFQKSIFGPVEDEVFVDGGAYTGDTIESYLHDFALGGVISRGYMLGSPMMST